MARRYAGAYGSQSGGIGGGGGGGGSTLSSLQRTSEKNNEYLKGLARYAHRDLAEIFDAAEYKALTGDLVELAEEMATVKNVLDVTNVQCRAELAGESAADETDEQAVKRLKLGVEEAASSFQPHKSEIVVTIKDILKPKSKKATGSDDIEFVQQELTEKDFICPVTTTRFIDPMKNTGCSHKVSKAGLELLLSGRGQQGVRCFQPGCSAKWTASSASPDTELEFEMDRFFRLKDGTRATQYSQSSHRR